MRVANIMTANESGPDYSACVFCDDNALRPHVRIDYGDQTIEYGCESCGVVYGGLSREQITLLQKHKAMAKAGEDLRDLMDEAVEDGLPIPCPSMKYLIGEYDAERRKWEDGDA